MAATRCRRQRRLADVATVDLFEAEEGRDAGVDAADVVAESVASTAKRTAKEYNLHFSLPESEVALISSSTETNLGVNPLPVFLSTDAMDLESCFERMAPP